MLIAVIKRLQCSLIGSIVKAIFFSNCKFSAPTPKHFFLIDVDLSYEFACVCVFVSLPTSVFSLSHFRALCWSVRRCWSLTTQFAPKAICAQTETSTELFSKSTVFSWLEGSLCDEEPRPCSNIDL